MKNLPIILFCLFSISLLAQNIEVAETVELTGKLGKQIEKRITIQNNSNQAIDLIIRRTDRNIGSTQNTWFCLGDECFDARVSQTPLSFRLEPGEVTNKFRVVLSTGLSEGYSSVSYKVFEKTNPLNESRFTVNYTIEGKANSDDLLNTDKLVIRDVYPNPVRDYAVVEYDIKDPNSESKIVLHSILGTVVNEFTLNPSDTRLKMTTESLNPGIYFYTIYLNGDGLLTKKIIVQK